MCTHDRIKIRGTAPNQTHCAKLEVRNTMANRIVAAPPTSRGTPCIMLSNVTGAQVSDTTDDASSNAAG